MADRNFENNNFNNNNNQNYNQYNNGFNQNPNNYNNDFNNQFQNKNSNFQNLENYNNFNSQYQYNQGNNFYNNQNNNSYYNQNQNNYSNGINSWPNNNNQFNNNLNSYNNNPFSENYNGNYNNYGYQYNGGFNQNQYDKQFMEYREQNFIAKNQLNQTIFNGEKEKAKSVILCFSMLWLSIGLISSSILGMILLSIYLPFRHTGLANYILMIPTGLISTGWMITKLCSFNKKIKMRKSFVTACYVFDILFFASFLPFITIFFPFNNQYSFQIVPLITGIFALFTMLIFKSINSKKILTKGKAIGISFAMVTLIPLLFGVILFFATKNFVSTSFLLFNLFFSLLLFIFIIICFNKVKKIDKMHLNEKISNESIKLYSFKIGESILSYFGIVLLIIFLVILLVFVGSMDAMSRKRRNAEYDQDENSDSLFFSSYGFF